MGCCLCLAFIMLMLSLLACACSFLAPMWTINDGLITKLLGTQTKGLVGYCTGDNCYWLYENEFNMWKDGTFTDWEKAVQGLMGFGLLTILCAFLIACIHLCCQCCRRSFSITHLVSGLLLFAFLELGVGLVLYGVKANEERGVDLSNSHRFYWAYWVGCGAALLDLLATFLYVCEGCRGGYAGYTRGEVV